MTVMHPSRRARVGLFLATMALASSPAGMSVLAQGQPGSLPPRDGPLEPGDALASFRTLPGLRVELVAAEPMVVSPVAWPSTSRGRLYVAENRGYPTGPGAGSRRSAGSRCSRTPTATAGWTAAPSSPKA